MRKLNKKGFTLIELLAIIVILAIIMVVTIPTVLGSLGDARKKTFQASANTVAEWFEKQYSIDIVADNSLVGSISASYPDECKKGSLSSTCNSTTKHLLTAAELNAAGVKADNYSYTTYKADGTVEQAGTSTVYISNGRACVTLTASGTGDFSSLTGTDKTTSSSGC